MILENGFLDFDPVHLDATGEGPLQGLTFAVKDVFDIAGTVTGVGQPSWRASQPPARHTSPMIETLLAAGAELIGKTHTDELTYSLAGQNAHYGTPPNPAVPGAVPGGSSSGSASVVAAALVDFALGSDTGGSVRVPASYCGIHGLRPTHGVVDYRHCAHLAESFDTLGWFARDARLMARIGRILLPASDRPAPRRLLLVEEALAQSDADVVSQLEARVGNGLPGVTFGGSISVGNLDTYFNAFRPLQAYEAWARFGSWIEAEQPVFGPGVKERFEAASRITTAEAEDAREQCRALRTRIRALLGEDTLLCLPTTPTSALPLQADQTRVEDIRGRTLRMTALAGTTGLPQLSLPLLRDREGPVGLSLIGPAGSDQQLLDLAARLPEFIST